MALTAKMRKFAEAIAEGKSNKESAISAGYSPETASQQGSKLSKNPDVIAYIEKLKSGEKVKAEVKAEKPVVTIERIQQAEQAQGQFVGRDETVIGSKDDPLEYLKSVWTNEYEEQELRLAAARAALPYIHGKVADKGKKEAKAEEAKNKTHGGGKFGTLGSQMRS